MTTETELSSDDERTRAAIRRYWRDYPQGECPSAHSCILLRYDGNQYVSLNNVNGELMRYRITPSGQLRQVSIPAQVEEATR
jgi:hypothetical protein